MSVQGTEQRRFQQQWSRKHPCENTTTPLQIDHQNKPTVQGNTTQVLTQLQQYVTKLLKNLKQFKPFSGI